MPNKIDPKVRQRCVQQMLDHVAEFPSPTAAVYIGTAQNLGRFTSPGCGRMIG